MLHAIIQRLAAGREDAGREWESRNGWTDGKNWEPGFLGRRYGVGEAWSRHSTRKQLSVVRDTDHMASIAPTTVIANEQVL
jgi:hypothetical protein